MNLFIGVRFTFINNLWRYFLPLDIAATGNAADVAVDRAQIAIWALGQAEADPLRLLRPLAFERRLALQ